MDQNVLTTRPFPALAIVIMGRPAVALRPSGAGVACGETGAGLMVCPWFRIGDSIVRTIALTATFDHAADVTLDELRAELIYPLDEQADRFFRGHGAGGASH